MNRERQRDAASGYRVATVLEPDERSSREARAWLRDAMRGRRIGFDVTDALLVVSELVTNAVRHGCGEIRLSATFLADGLRVEVADGHDGEPVRPGVIDHDLESGRGTLIVARLCRDWGVRRDAAGKTVWAELGD